LQTLRVLAKADAEVENVQMFGDRLHLRVHPGAAERVVARLSQQGGGDDHGLHVRAIPAQLEDVFIALTDGEHPGAGMVDGSPGGLST
jgi:hypothetical protein